MIVYCETSALNYLCDKLSIPDAVATKVLQREKGRRWVISPVTIWEVLLTSNDQRKEQLINFAQYLFDAELLPSPEEMLVKYIEQGCPLVETPRPLRSGSELAAVWRDLCEFPDKTFIYDKQDRINKTRLIARVIRDLHKLTRHREITLLPYTTDVAFDLTLQQLVNQMSFVRDGAYIDNEQRNLYKISMFYILVILCVGAGVDRAPIAAFWRRLGIMQTVDRWLYLLRQHEVLIYRGPFLQMAYMTLVQARTPYSRGLYWDSLHCSYVTYVEWLLAEDPHFQDLKMALGEHSLANRLRRPSQMEWTFETRDVHFPESFIKT